MDGRARPFLTSLTNLTSPVCWCIATKHAHLEQLKKDEAINAYDFLCTTHGRDRFLVSGTCASAGILERAQPTPERGGGGGDGSDKQLQSERLRRDGDRCGCSRYSPGRTARRPRHDPYQGEQLSKSLHDYH